jgi:hypothetical protein
LWLQRISGRRRLHAIPELSFKASGRGRGGGRNWHPVEPAEFQEQPPVRKRSRERKLVFNITGDR